MNSLYIMIAKCFEILKKKIINFIHTLISLAFGICFFFIKKESRIVKILSIVQSIIIFALNIPIILDISFSSLCSCCCKKKDEENTKKTNSDSDYLSMGEKLLHSLSGEVNILQALDDKEDEEKVSLLTEIKEKHKLREVL